MWVWASAYAADCDGSTPGLEAALTNAERAFGQADLPAFQSASDQARATAACGSAVFPRRDIARLHRVDAIRAFLDRTPDRVSDAFEAAKSIEPEFMFSAEIVPESHPLRAQIEAAKLGAATSPLVAPPGVTLYVDGLPSLVRPTDRNLLLQAGDGPRIGHSAYLTVADPLPAWADGAAVLAKKRRAARRTTLLVAGIGTGVVAGALYGLSASSAAKYHDAATPYDQEAALRGSTNGLVVGSGALGAAGLGLVIIGVLTPR